MEFTLKNVQMWIDDYHAEHPDGVDVTAHVLSQIGKETAAAYAARVKIGPGEANQEIGRTVREMIRRKYPQSEVLQEIPVNPERWPTLAGWVHSYTAHRIKPAL